MAGKIKVSKNGKLFFSHVVTSGRVQKAFGDQIGRPVGACVANGVRKGMGIQQIHQVARDCARQYRGTHLSLGGTRTPTFRFVPETGGMERR